MAAQTSKEPGNHAYAFSADPSEPDLLHVFERYESLEAVGRLDWASEGLLVLTNDGALANGLMKAASNVAKTYVVKVAGQPDDAKLEKLRKGVSIAEKGGRRVRTAPAKIRLIREGDNPWLEVTIVEGRNRQIRKMFEEVGHHVEKIRRVRYGPLSLDVPPGEFRSLTLDEVSLLNAAASGLNLAHARRHVAQPQLVVVRRKKVSGSVGLSSGSQPETLITRGSASGGWASSASMA
jgi:23S rRNA pseudouridine2605 synthase